MARDRPQKRSAGGTFASPRPLASREPLMSVLRRSSVRLVTLLSLVLCLTLLPEAPLLAQDGDQGGAVKELRIGLVCYGGVSLAIYMHGNTKEIHRLVQASAALDRDATHGTTATSPSGPGRTQLHDTATYYYDMLHRLWREEGVRTRVIVDVISGTSAGGINGILLGKAIAHDLDQGPLRELWLDRAAIQKLLAMPPLFRYPPLKGNAIYSWVLEALAKMDQGATAAPASLVPEGQRLDLFVTATDYYGQPQHVLGGDPEVTLEKRHAHVLHFRYDGRETPGDGQAHFSRKWNPALAFAARATSSFPGAFPPVDLSIVDRERRYAAEGAVDAKEMGGTLFRGYELENPNGTPEFATSTRFMDGGVIDNYPFAHTIREITRRTSSHEVRRVLIYLQPDPGKPPAPGPDKQPGWIRTIVAGAATVNGHEPILQDLQRIQDHNQRVARLRDIVREEERKGKDAGDSVASKVRGELAYAGSESAKAEFVAPSSALQPRAIEGFRAQRLDVERRAAGESELLDRGYRNLRVYSVLEQFTTVIAGRCRFTEDSAQTQVVREAILEFARSSQLIGPGSDESRQLALLEDFDLGYLRRQLRFVSDWLSEQYRPDGTRGYARIDRAQLDDAKKAVWRQIEKLNFAIGGRTEATEATKDLPDPLAPLAALFCDMQPWQKGASAPRRQGSDLAAREKVRLEHLRNSIGDTLRSFQDRVRTELFGEFLRITTRAGWPAEAREEVMARFIAFPYWDRLLYPYTAFNNLGELRRIEVFRISPDDALALQGGIAAKKLVGATKGHFGAFFKRRGRESDYVWGRLDAVERLTHLVRCEQGSGTCQPPPRAVELQAAACAIFDEERAAGDVRAAVIGEFGKRFEGTCSSTSTASRRAR
jgi:patatin-related protein